MQTFIASAKVARPNTNDSSVADLVAGALNYLNFFIAVAAVASLVYAGILFITSSGNPDRVKKARSALLYSIIGIIVVVFSFAIVLSLGSIINN